MRLEQNAAMKRLFAVDEKYDATLEDYEPIITELKWEKSQRTSPKR